MSASRFVPVSWRACLRALLVWSGAIAAALAIRREEGTLSPASVAVEAGCYLAAFLWLWSVRPFHAYVTRLPRPHQWLFGAVFTLCLTSQLAHASRLTFPVVAWEVYARAEHRDVLVFYQFQGIDEHGRAAQVNAESLLRSLSNMAVATKFKQLAKAVLSPTGDAAKQQERQRRLADTLLAMGRLYNRRHPDRPIRWLALMRCSLDLRTGDASTLRREPVWRVDLSERRSAP
jgi:hypothetical protein